jgi:DNA helicase-2/ATP-dependent DNA helicase PcrA
MNIQELLDILFPKSGQKQLTGDQERVVKHPNGPAWILAGPGSGKTEVLAVLVLRLLYIDDDVVQKARVQPESVVVTTFTDKAARNLEDRISQYRCRRSPKSVEI